MIELLLIAITWYITKYYYTRSFTLDVQDMDELGLIQATCSKCAISSIIDSDNMRTPYYCISCKQTQIAANSYIPPPINMSNIPLRRLYMWSKVEHSGEYLLQILLDQLQYYRQIDICVIEHTPFNPVMSNLTNFDCPHICRSLHIFRDLSIAVVNGIFCPHLSIDFYRKF